MPTIIKMLDLSTAHLPPHVLASDGEEITCCHPKHAGLFMWVPSDPFDPDESGRSGDADPAVLAVRAYARSLGCDWILFDADADIDPALPIFDPPEPVETCGRCGREFPAGGACDGPGYHP